MIISDLFSSKDSCPVCGQTPCNCTSIKESIHNEDCHLCKGTGEGLFDGESCPVCDGTGIEPKSRNDDDFVEPDDYDDADYGDEESYYEKSLRNRGLGEQGVAESDISGLMHAARNYNKSFLITAELAEGGKKTFRVKAQSERVAREKFTQHHNQATIISVKEEGVAEGSKYEIHQHDREGKPLAIYHHGSDHNDDVIRQNTQYRQKMNPRDTFKVFKDKKPFDWQGVAEGQQWPDSSNSLAKRSAVATNLKGAPSKAGRSSGMTVATRVDPTITPTTVKKLGGERPVPSFLKKNVDEAGQQKGADYRDPKEADYGDDYQAMVSRVKKLAGLGPLKTVYDPAKRVYKNVPTAVQPGDKK